MSRSNHFYYNHTQYDYGWNSEGIFEAKKILKIKEEQVDGRRPWKRKHRFPEYSAKSWHHGPPAWWDKMMSREARAKQREELLNSPDDPVITPRKRLINLRSWY